MRPTKIRSLLIPLFVAGICLVLCASLVRVERVPGG